MSILLLSLALTAGEIPAAATAAEASGPQLEGPKRMTPSQIRAYNAGLTRGDRAYIKCIRSEPTGSLVASTVCRTNGEWERLAAQGNADVREFTDYMKTHQFSVGRQ